MTLPTAINPWKIHAKEVIFENPWLKLVNYKTSNPKGHPVDYGVVRFKNRAIGVVPYFLAQGLHFGASNLDDSEDISVRKIPLDNLYDYVERGEITDSLSVTAIYKLKLMQLSGQIL